MNEIYLPKFKQSRKAEYPISPFFLFRWSPRAFLDKQVPDEELFSLFEAARWAPSGGNIQPWKYIIARTQEDREKFFTFINPSNRTWCEKAPVLAVLLSNKLRSSGNPNRNHAFDTGASWGYLALEASQRGLFAHAMGGFDPELARETLSVPEEYDILVVIAIGYHGDVHLLSENDQEREIPSNRRPIQESMFEGGFGDSVKGI